MGHGRDLGHRMRPAAQVGCTEAEADVSYQFISVPNESSLTIGEITGIVKEGQHVAWVEFEDEVHSGSPVKQAVRVHVDRVYDVLDFAAFFGWS